MSYSPFFLNQNSRGSTRSLTANFQNGSGSTLVMAVPVSVNASSQLVPLNVSSEASTQAIVGLTSISIPNAATGSVVDSGRLENITTSFAVGDAVYAGKLNPLTNSKPNIGDSEGFTTGDFVVFIGVIVKNEFNPILFDLKLMISVAGQL